jgi:hypothetical protein
MNWNVHALMQSSFTRKVISPSSPPRFEQNRTSVGKRAGAGCWRINSVRDSSKSVFVECRNRNYLILGKRPNRSVSAVQSQAVGD